MMKTSVSLYSYQLSYYIGKLDLEGCIREAAKAGSQGIELIAEQMPVGGSYPRVEKQDVSQWFDWMAKYNVTPTCMDTFCDIMMFKNRFLTRKEQVQLFRQDLELAHKLGFKYTRVIHNIQPEVIEMALPIAADNDIKMCFEIHSPMRIRSEFIQRHVEMIERTGTKNYGFMPDWGIFPLPKKIPTPEEALAAGVSQKAIDFVKAQKGPIAMSRLFGLTSEGFSDQDAHYIMEALPNEMDAPNELEWLEDIAPYIYHCHAKCLHMNENCEDDRIDAAGAVKMLKKIGYDGYLSTEYEGQRSAPGAEDDAADELIDEIEQVRRHQVMLHRLIAEA